MRKPFVYLAGPYSKPDPAVNTRVAILAGQRLRDELDIVTIVPHVTHFEQMLAPKPYDYWLAIDIDILAGCDALLRMPGGSSGADAEVEFCFANKIPVFFSEHKLAEWVKQWRQRESSDIQSPIPSDRSCP